MINNKEVNSNSKVKNKKQLSLKGISYTFLLIAVVCFVIALLINYNSASRKGKKTIISSSTLKEVIDIAELSTAEFTYNGIAQKFKDDSQKLQYSIRYNAVVKAGIDPRDVEFELDDQAKSITPILPDIKLTVTIDGDNKLKFIPNDIDIDLKTAMDLCEQDAYKEATESGELYEIAEENLKATIEALTYPLIEAEGYHIVWR